MNFSERHGLSPIQQIQIDGMTGELRNSLWNSVYLAFFEGKLYDRTYYTVLDRVFKSYWIHFFRNPIDSLSSSQHDNLREIRRLFFSMPWHSVYDLIEFSLFVNKTIINDRQFSTNINHALERENSAYRIIGDTISPVTSTQEIQEITKSLRTTNAGAKAHISRALDLMANRENPDFRNSIKESISAVESVCYEIVGDDKSTLGKLLNKIQASANMHQSLAKAFSSLYGWTSDEGGIRHAMLEEPNLSLADARFMLVACSAFVNYALDKTK